MYSFDAARMVPAALQHSLRGGVRLAAAPPRPSPPPPVVLQLRPGAGTKSFVESYRPIPLAKDLLFRVLACVMPSSTEAAALLGVRNMLVLDAEAIAAVLDAGDAWRRGDEGLLLKSPAHGQDPLIASWRTAVAQPGGGHAAATERPMAHRRPGRCLDMGAGVGTTTAELQRVFPDVTATDVSTGCLKRLRQRQPPLQAVMHVQARAEVDRGIAPSGTMVMAVVVYMLAMLARTTTANCSSGGSSSSPSIWCARSTCLTDAARGPYHC